MATDKDLSAADLEESVNVELDGTCSTPVKYEKETKDGEAATIAGTQKIKFEGHRCPVKNVTVFLDRAEVNRIVDLDISYSETEAVICGLPSVIDEDSVRVQCKGDATIVEVKYSEKVFKDDNAAQEKSDNESKEKVLRDKIEQLENDKMALEATLTSHEQKMKVLKGYSERVAQGNRDCDKVTELVDKKVLENVASFLEYWSVQSEKINKQVFATKERLSAVNKDIITTKKELSEICPKSKGDKRDRSVSVMLEGKSQGKVQLTLSYVVKSASWSPVYDLRAFSKDNLLQLLYFGVIRQTTGEDWEDALISLSTAMPSVGGSAPEVPTKELSIEFSYGSNNLKSGGSMMRKKRKAAPSGMLGSAAQASKSLMRGMLMSDDVSDEQEEYCAMPCAAVSEGVTSTCFEILRPSTIKSDNSDHKVSISLIELTPEFEYEISPKLVAHAFLKASVKNESEYALLAGSANVFLDNNFLTKSSLGAVSPSEKFHISLGADPSVKVTYHPVKKFQHNIGIFSKSIKLNYEQKITINNTKSKAISVKVTDQVPKSTNDKIKVHLTSPDIPPTTSKTDVTVVPPVQINSKNNIEWHSKLDPAAEKDFVFTYTVDYPTGISVAGL